MAKGLRKILTREGIRFLSIVILIAAAMVIFRAPLNRAFSAMVLVVYWVFMVNKRNVFVFYVLLGCYLIIYYRISLFPGRDRAVISIVDFLWGIYFVNWVVRKSKEKKITGFLKNVRIESLSGYIAYESLTIILPIIGVLVYMTPFLWASPGIRQIEWVSFAFMSIDMVRKKGPSFIRGVLAAVVVVVIVQCIYAVIQAGCSMKVLPQSLLYLDNLHKEIGGREWFTTIRVTGLFLNPNAFGHFAWMVLMVMLGMQLGDVHKKFASVLFPLSFVLVILSGSRSALIGAVLGCFLILLNVKITSRSIKATIIGAIGIVMIFYFVWPILPEQLHERFERLGMLIKTGDVAEERNAEGRVQLWQSAWNQYVEKYYFGTMVPPSYMLSNAMDSYYVYSAVMGTPLYTLFFILMLLNTVVFAKNQLARYSMYPEVKVVAISLIGISGGLMGSSLGSSPMLLVHIQVPFWALTGMMIGLKVYLRKEMMNGNRLK